MTGAATSAGLRRAAADFFRIPAGFWQPDTPDAVAAQILGCSLADLTVLTDLGLQSRVTDDTHYYDQHDLFNLARWSGSRRSPAEIAFEYALRWMRASTLELTARRRWRFRAESNCSAPEHCDGSCLGRYPDPQPQLYAGIVEPFDRSAAECGLPPGAGAAGDRPPGVMPSAWQSLITIDGEVAPIESAVIREIYRAFLIRRPRWVKLPAALQTDVDLLSAHGVATCISASLQLERELVEAGVTVRTRRGWVLGMLDLAHAWIEVVDSDGRTKVLDPVFALLAAEVPTSNPALYDPDISLRTNRLIPVDRTAGEPMLLNADGAGGCRDAAVTTTFEPVRETLEGAK